MAEQPLSKVLLRFKDPELTVSYKKEKTEFFTKTLPIVSGMLGLISLVLETAYSQYGLGDLP